MLAEQHQRKTEDAHNADYTPFTSGEDNVIVRMSHIQLVFPAVAGGDDVTVLRDVNLDIPRGRTIALIGSSGSGKTSLLGIIAGLQKPTGGKMLIQGRDTTHFTEEENALIRREVTGVVFQHFYLIPTLNALQNAALPLEILDNPDAIDIAREALSAVGLRACLDRYPHQLSGGEQQRVAIVRAFISGAKLILADEPTGNLDDANTQLVMDTLLQQCADTQASLLLITHDHRLLPRFDQVIELSNGVIKPAA